MQPKSGEKCGLRAVARLRATGRYRYAEPNLIGHLSAAVNDPLRHMQWNLDLMEAETIWDATTGQEAVVGVIDTGLSPGTDGIQNVANGVCVAQR